MMSVMPQQRQAITAMNKAYDMSHQWTMDAGRSISQKRIGMAILALSTQQARGYRLVHGPAAPQSFSQHGTRQAQDCPPFLNRLGFSVVGDGSIRAFVLALFQPRGPSAIPRLVMAVVVDAIERVIRRAVAHVGKKCLKVVSPLLGHTNAATAVVIRVFMARVVAAFFRLKPRAVFPSSASSVCCARSQRLIQQASTAFHRAITKVASAHNCALAALAQADPFPMSGGFVLAWSNGLNG